MSTKNFHVSEDGILRRCRATKAPCRLEHYASEKEAEVAIAEHMEGQTLSTLTKTPSGSAENDSESVISTDSSVADTGSSQRRGDTISADNSYTYAIFQAQTGFLHNAGSTGEPPELFYYSSPAGRLELERRIKMETRSDNVYLEMRDTIDAEGFEPISLDSEIDEEKFVQDAEIGRQMLADGFSDYEETSRREDIEVGSYLIQKSHQWLSNLSTEEQEAVSYNTSSGSVLAVHSVGIGGANVSSMVNATTRQLVKDGVTVDELAEKHRKTLVSACSKAPLFEEPVTIYRGADEVSLVGMIDGSGNDSEALYQKMVNNELAGSTDIS